MISKSASSYTSYDKGNPKPSLIKKKARTTILNVLNKRQNQERNLAQAYSADQPPATVRRAEPHQTQYKQPYRQTSTEPTTTTEQPTRDIDRYPKRGRQSSVSSLVRKWSGDNLVEPRVKATSFSGATPTSPPKTQPKSVVVQKSCYSSQGRTTPDTSFQQNPPKHEDEENRYSVVIQTRANYPSPTRRKSSADVTPHDVTVNAIRVYEATTNMVNADPELIASLDRYPSREPPVMSPTTVQQFTWEKDIKTGVEQKTRAVVVKGKPLVSTSQNIMNTSINEKAMRPRLVSDSVQVSIPFGVPDAPPTTSRSSNSDGWSSSVSVCVPFQVTNNQVKPLPVRGSAGPQALQSSRDGLAIDDLNDLFDRSTDSGSLGMITSTAVSTMEQEPHQESPSSPTLVTVRRKPEDELVQKIIHFQDSTVSCGNSESVFDDQDGHCLSKRGNYTLVDNDYTSTGAKNSPSSVLAKSPQQVKSDSQKIRPRATLVDSKSPHGATKVKTATVTPSNKNELEMLRARIRQLEAELADEKAKHTRNDSIPKLEKEKLRLQTQINDILLELTKAKSQLQTSTYTTNRLQAEKEILEMKNKKLEKDFEKLQNEYAAIQFQRDQLVREKKNRTNEKDMDVDANLVTIQSLSKRNEELCQSESELKETVCVLVEGLRQVRKSVLKVKKENEFLHKEIVCNGVAMSEAMKKCFEGLQQVVDRINIDSNESVDNDEMHRLNEELADNKSCMHALLQRVVELETNSADSAPINYDGCPNCAKLEEEIKELHMDYDELSENHTKLEENFEELSNDRDDLQEETKYLKKVLSYRQDIMEVQVSEKTNRQLQRLETNLEEAEKKCKDLEDEVGNLFKQKQSLLENIMKLHDEEVANQNDTNDDDDDISDDDDYSSDEPNTPHSRSKSGSLKRSLYANIPNEAEFSSGASFYGSDTDSDSESDEWSDLDSSPRRVQDLVSGLKSDRKRLKSNLKELMHDKRTLNKRIDKSTKDFKSLMQRMEKLDSENNSLRDKVKAERRSLKAKLKKEEKESEKLRESLKDMESEKAALMKCIEMNSATVNEVENDESKEELEDDDMSRLIAKAQAFAQGEKETKLQKVEEESEDEIESSDEKDNEEDKTIVEENESDAKSSTSSEEEPEVHKEPQRLRPPPRARVIPPLIIQKDPKSESEDDKDEEARDEIKDVLSPPPPPPQARLLQRRASTVGINMDRVNREKQHLEEEVASLKKYLNKSANRRRFSTVESPKAPPLEAMKTLQSLLQKSDMELKEANAKICRLQSLNADLEERLKDSEVNQDDLRRAVVIANNYAAEEREKNTALEEERDDLMQKIELLKRENSKLKKSKRRGNRVKSVQDGDMMDSDGPDIESDLSRRSSIASDL